MLLRPQSREQSEPSPSLASPYALDSLRIQSYSQAPQLHTRIKEALSNRVVWNSIQPSKLLSLTKLQEAAQIELQYYPVEALTTCFFSYYNWTHIWNEDVLRDAIKVGVRNGTFAYVANARKNEQGQLIVSGPASSTVHCKQDISAREVDTGSGAYLLSASLAQQLLVPFAPAKNNNETSPTPSLAPRTIHPQPGSGQEQPASITNSYIRDERRPFSSQSKNEAKAGQLEESRSQGSIPVTPRREGRTYHLHLRATPEQLFDIWKSMQKLGEYSSSLDIDITATAKAEQSFMRNTLHNLIVEPMMEESDVVIIKEQVEE